MLSFIMAAQRSDGNELEGVFSNDICSESNDVLSGGHTRLDSVTLLQYFQLDPVFKP